MYRVGIPYSYVANFLLLPSDIGSNGGPRVNLPYGLASYVGITYPTLGFVVTFRHSLVKPDGSDVGNRKFHK